MPILLLAAALVMGMFSMAAPAQATSAPAAAATPVAKAPWPIVPGMKGPRVREVQQRLKQAGLYAGPTRGFYNPATAQAVTDFQTQKGLPVTGNVDRRTYRQIKASTNQPGLRLDPRCLTGRVLCIDKRKRVLRWVVDGKVRKALAVRFGASYSPTREGSFRVQVKSRDHVSSLFDSPMPFAMFFSGGQAVHYSSDFARRGYSGASHGCVNVRDYGGIRWLFDQVRVGDKVIIYWSKR